jgi:hypothetical protein
MAAPGSVPALLSGRPAVGWSRLALKAFLVGVPAVLLMPVASMSGQPVRGLALPVLLLVAVAAGLVGLAAGIRLAVAQRREWEAGYTTLHGQRFDLWQLDPRDGAVLRRPGERTARRDGGAAGR